MKKYTYERGAGFVFKKRDQIFKFRAFLAKCTFIRRVDFRANVEYYVGIPITYSGAIFRKLYSLETPQEYNKSEISICFRMIFNYRSVRVYRITN